MASFSTSGDQLEGQVPQPFGIVAIDSVGCVSPRKVRRALRDLFCLIAILKVKATDAFQEWRCGEHYRRRRSLLQSLTFVDGRLDAPDMFLQTRGDRTWMKGV